MLLPSNNYNFCDVSVWLLYRDHLEEAGKTEGCRSYVHWAIGNVESVPFLGQGVSYLDLLIAKIVDFFWECFCPPEAPEDEEKLTTLLSKFPEDLREEIRQGIIEAPETNEFEIDFTTDFQIRDIFSILEQLKGFLPPDTCLKLYLCPHQLHILDSSFTKIFPDIHVSVNVDDRNDFDFVQKFVERSLENITLNINLDFVKKDLVLQNLENALDHFLSTTSPQSPLCLAIDFMTENGARSVHAFMSKTEYSPERFSLVLCAPCHESFEILPGNIGMLKFSLDLALVSVDLIEKLIPFNNMTELEIISFADETAPPTAEISLLAKLSRSIKLRLHLSNQNYELPTDLFDILKHHNVETLHFEVLSQNQLHELRSLFPLAEITANTLT